VRAVQTVVCRTYCCSALTLMVRHTVVFWLQQDIINRHPEHYRMKLVPVAAPHEAPFLRHYNDLDPDRQAP